MGDEEPVSQQPPADEEQDQNQQDQTTGEPDTSQQEGDEPGVSDAPADIPPDSIFGGG
jgi:hypothetical protein